MIIPLDSAQIDWHLLRDQKLWLIGQQRNGEIDDHAAGLTSLIDYVQDQAIAAGVPEAIVFTDHNFEED